MRLAAAILLLTCAAAAHAAGEVGLNIYGLSYHFERDKAEELGIDNEVNPGLGLRYRFHEEEKLDWFADAGVYRDGGRNHAAYGGGGVLYKLTRNLKLGGALALFYSDTYNRGDPFIAPIPLLVYDWGHVSFNMVYFAKVSGINEINTLGFWLTIWPKRKE